VQFNLAHSGDVALVAVSAGAPVGVDVERWDRDVEHLELAERFFSPVERRTLNALVERDEVVPGFFACWTRKEAYLKATGVGITRGLDYFDVSLDPREDARLIEDRLEPGAVNRWTMKAISVRDKYSAAVVADTSTTRVELFDTPALT
jgi:4'-phosphopantetheinyl transferase